VDTLQASMSLGLIALGVADAVRGGAEADEALEAARHLTGTARLFGAVDTLEYLHKGGRIGRAQMLLGSALRIKPVLSLVDGIAAPVDRTRTLARGLTRLRTMCEERAPLSALSVISSTEPDTADRLSADLADLAPGGQIIQARFGPIVGAYLGPKAIGVALT
jgi:DegV family protein with EDD domain